STRVPPLPPRPPILPRFPYTTLFRSIGNVDRHSWQIRASRVAGAADRYSRRACGGGATACDTGSDTGIIRRHFGLCAMAGSAFRSEEHTSELQSRFDLVCRLLLEKKK